MLLVIFYHSYCKLSLPFLNIFEKKISTFSKNLVGWSVENDPMGSNLDLDLDLDPMAEVDHGVI
jgi:hypothetical protein